jgi:hypothetical protein
LAGSQGGSISQSLGYTIWLCSPLFWVGIGQLSMPAIGITLLGQLGILATLTKVFRQRLEILGAVPDRPLNARAPLVIPAQLPSNRN